MSSLLLEIRGNFFLRKLPTHEHRKGKPHFIRLFVLKERPPAIRTDKQFTFLITRSAIVKSSPLWNLHKDVFMFHQRVNVWLSECN